MKYISVKWNRSKQEFPESPILQYSELDDARREQRKVCVFREGPPGYASKTKAMRGVMLGFEPVPSLLELEKRTEYPPPEITPEEFERLWKYAISNPVDSHALWDSFLAVLANL
jgi:uncharacterized protein DUF6881